MELNPWDDPFFGGSKSKWMNYCRSALRKAWTRYPPKNQFIREHRFRMSVGYYKNGKKKSVWAAECEMCKQRLPLGKLQVDHITPAGAMDGLDGMGAWASRLFCHKDNMQFLCKPCHRVKSIQDVYQISVSEARREVFYNETVKMSVAAQKRVLELLRLSQHDTNKSSREKAFKTLLKIHWK